MRPFGGFRYSTNAVYLPVRRLHIDALPCYKKDSSSSGEYGVLFHISEGHDVWKDHTGLKKSPGFHHRHCLCQPINISGCCCFVAYFVSEIGWSPLCSFEIITSEISTSPVVNISSEWLKKSEKHSKIYQSVIASQFLPVGKKFKI